MMGVTGAWIIALSVVVVVIVAVIVVVGWRTLSKK